MLQQPGQREAGETALMTTKDRRVQALRLVGLIAMGAMLSACDRCGDFWPRSQSQIGACHSDSPRQP